MRCLIPFVILLQSCAYMIAKDPELILNAAKLAEEIIEEIVEEDL